MEGSHLLNHDGANMHRNGFAVSQLPERFQQQQPRSEALSRYINAKYGAYGFRKRRDIEFNREWVPEGQERAINPDRYRWVENVSEGLRKAGDAHDLVRLGHTGWFTDDEYQDETVHGEVYQLPGKDGQPRYVPAVSDPNNSDCACVDFRSMTDDKEQAARWADSMAESWAEREREYRTKDRNEQRIAEIAEEIQTEYAEFRRIAKELKASKVQGVQVVRELVKERWQRTKRRIHKLRNERDELQEAL